MLSWITWNMISPKVSPITFHKHTNNSSDYKIYFPCYVFIHLLTLNLAFEITCTKCRKRQTLLIVGDTVENLEGPRVQTRGRPYISAHVLLSTVLGLLHCTFSLCAMHPLKKLLASFLLSWKGLSADQTSEPLIWILPRIPFSVPFKMEGIPFTGFPAPISSHHSKLFV